MNEPLGEYGGEVTRKVTLFQEEYQVGDILSPELLGEVSLRHRMALRGAGLIRYFNEPESAAALINAKPMEVIVTDNQKPKSKTAPAKKKTKKKTPSKSTAKRRN